MSASNKPSSIPIFGARRFARRLLAEVHELQARLSAEEAKTQKLAETGRNLVADARAIQAERDHALAQLNALGGLPILELEKRKQEAQTEIAKLRELSDASVPFNFDVHALFFSNDAVGIESAMHEKRGYPRIPVRAE